MWSIFPPNVCHYWLIPSFVSILVFSSMICSVSSSSICQLLSYPSQRCLDRCASYRREYTSRNWWRIFRKPWGKKGKSGQGSWVFNSLFPRWWRGWWGLIVLKPKFKSIGEERGTILCSTKLIYFGHSNRCGVVARGYAWGGGCRCAY